MTLRKIDDPLHPVDARLSDTVHPIVSSGTSSLCRRRVSPCLGNGCVWTPAALECSMKIASMTRYRILSLRGCVGHKCRTGRSIVLAVVVSVLVACGKDAPTESGVPGIRVIAGAGVLDTIEAEFAQALVVEVRKPGGVPASNTVVRFEVQRVTDQERLSETTVSVCSLASQACGGFAGTQIFQADTTDMDGRASVRIRFGTFAATAVIEVRVPEYGFVDSLRFVVRPGAPAGVQTTTPNLTINIGASAPMRAAVIDRARNVRPEPVTFTARAGTALTVDGTTGVVSAREMGTQAVVASFGSFAVQAQVTAVPPGRLVAWDPGRSELRLVNTNGGDTRFLLSGIDSEFGAFPMYGGSGERITVLTGAPAVGGGDSRRVVVADTTGTPRRNIGPSDTVGIILAHRALNDGTVRVVGVSGTVGALWSIATDNAATRLAALPGLIETYAAADISPDGRKIAFLATTPSLDSEMRVLDVTTGAVTVVAGPSRSPRWSPDGARLLFTEPNPEDAGLDGTLWVVNANGTNRRSLGPTVFVPGLAWSPDAAYVIGRDGVGLRIVRVADLVTIALPWPQSSLYFQPDWR